MLKLISNQKMQIKTTSNNTAHIPDWQKRKKPVKLSISQHLEEKEILMLFIHSHGRTQVCTKILETVSHYLVNLKKCCPITQYFYSYTNTLGKFLQHVSTRRHIINVQSNVV